jgi:hypothetical protein
MPTAVAHLLGYLWLGALGIALCVTALTTDRRSRQVEEYATFCDPFGYLQIAQDTRRAVAERHLPNFSIETHHSRLLINLMKTRGLPTNHWDDLVTPLCYHYSPRADHIGVQYPPGAGLMLAAFPEGHALHRMNRVVIALFLITGIVMFAAGVIKRSRLFAGSVVLALVIGLEMLARIDNASFSINAMFAPLLLSALSLSAAFIVGERRSLLVAWLLTFLAGWFFGFAILVRLQIVFLLPGLLILIFPARLRDVMKSGLVSFLFGVLVGGIFPIMFNQSRVTGSWFESTYGVGNTDPPTLKSLLPNLHFYFDPGKSSQFNWALPVIFVGCIGFFLCLWRKGTANNARSFLTLSPFRLVLASLVMWAIPTAYFLTHEVTGHHYPLATIFLTSLMLGLGILWLEAHQKKNTTHQDIRNPGTRRWLCVAGSILALSPGFFACFEAWSTYEPANAERAPHVFSLPGELADEKAWIWSSELSGSFWYYARKPAHKINFSSPEARAMVYQFVQDRAEPQFIVGDGPDMQRMGDEMVQLGATLERRGEVDGYPYFLIHWPPDGPSKRAP